MRKSKFIYNFIWVTLFKLFIELVYTGYISKNFEKFSTNINDEKNMVSWILLLLSFIIINNIVTNKLSRTSTLILYIVYLYSYIPGISYWSLADLTNSFIIYFNLYWFYIFFLMFFYSKVKLPSKKITLNDDLRNKMFYLIFGFAVLFGIYYSYKHSGFRIHLNLNTVYDIRAQSKILNASTLENLLYYIVSTVVYPLYAIAFFKDKKWIQLTVALFMQLLMFSVEGHKFYLFVIPVGLIAYKFYNDKFIKQIPKLSILLIFVGGFERILLRSGYILSYFVRRTLYVPAQIDSYYFDFFTKNSPIYFAQDKILSRLGLKSPYLSRVSQLIGDVYGEGGNANTGLFGDAFANVGNVSVIIYPVIFLISMVLIDLITENVPKKHLMTVLVSIVVMLLNTDISGIIYNYIIPIFIILLFVDYSSDKETQVLKL